MDKLNFRLKKKKIHYRIQLSRIRGSLTSHQKFLQKNYNCHIIVVGCILLYFTLIIYLHQGFFSKFHLLNFFVQLTLRKVSLSVTCSKTSEATTASYVFGVERIKSSIVVWT